MVIETKRLILRPFLETDAADVYEYLKEPAVNCFASMKLNSLDEAKAEMKKRLGETEYYFAITLKNGGKVIGEIDAYPEAGEPHAGEDAVRDTLQPLLDAERGLPGQGVRLRGAPGLLRLSLLPKGRTAHLRLYGGLQSCQPAPVRKAGHALGGRVPGIYLLRERSRRNPQV